MMEILTPSAVKFIDKSTLGICDRMTSLANLLGYTPTHEEVKNKIVMGFENAFNVKLNRGSLTEKEDELVQELLERKYSNSQWNYRR
jgi:lipoate-protein ligase A